MTKRKGFEIFEKAAVQCLHCAKYFEKEVHHKCNTGFRKHKHKWLKLK